MERGASWSEQLDGNFAAEDSRFLDTVFMASTPLANYNNCGIVLILMCSDVTPL